MSDVVFEFGIGEGDEAIGTKITRWSAEKRKYRLGFANWPSLPNEASLDEAMLALLKDMMSEDETKPSTPKFVGCPRHYKPGVGYFVRKGPEYDQFTSDPPKTYVGTIIIQWASDENANVTAEHMKKLPTLAPWVFPKSKYQDISAAHITFPFGEHDLIVNCTDQQYQKMTFLPAKNSLFQMMLKRALGDEVVEKELGLRPKGDPRKPDPRAREICQFVIDRAREIYNKPLQSYVATDMSLDDIREKLGGESSPVSGGGGSVSAAEQAEVDGLLDEILD
jgi:hypothetical protein